MTGIAWVDTTACAAFLVVTVLTLIRLGLSRSLTHFLDDAFHAVMGVTMTAMFWPGVQTSTPVWIAVIGLIIVWPLLLLALVAGRSAVADGRGSLGHVSLGHTGYWLTCALLMVVSVGAGHHPNGSMTALAAGTPPVVTSPVGGHDTTSHSVGADSALGDTLQAVAGWPIWPLVGVLFLVYAGVLFLGLKRFGPRRPITERVCATVMAAGMSLMAFSL